MHLAQVNVARLRAPLDAPEIADFVAGLDPVNALAEAAPGFVWRLQDEGGNATSIPYDPDPLLIVNLSVWEGVEALRAFVYSGPHLDFLKRRREWFTRLATPYTAMWWVPVGERPTPEDARHRLLQLEAHGPTAGAFTFAHPFSPGGVPLMSTPAPSAPASTLLVAGPDLPTLPDLASGG